MAIVNNAIGNAGVQTALQNSDFIVLDEYPEAELLDHMVVLFLIFRGISIVSAPIYIPCISTQGLAHFFESEVTIRGLGKETRHVVRPSVTPERVRVQAGTEAGRTTGCVPWVRRLFSA